MWTSEHLCGWLGSVTKKNTKDLNWGPAVHFLYQLILIQGRRRDRTYIPACTWTCCGETLSHQNINVLLKAYTFKETPSSSSKWKTRYALLFFFWCLPCPENHQTDLLRVQLYPHTKDAVHCCSQTLRECQCVKSEKQFRKCSMYDSENQPWLCWGE